MSQVGEQNRRRCERTRRELASLRAEFAKWLKHRREKDPAGQHTSQLAAIEACIDGAAQGLAKHLDTLKVELPRGEFSEQCGLHELRILWLRRLWKFFRERLDQRDDAHLGALLRAADEVVWSAWRPVFERAPALGLHLSSGPSPLPFIDLEYSPAATPLSWVPKELHRDGGPLLANYLERLPLALVHIPVASIASPWWLVFIGHEVGHQLQHHLGLVVSFREHLKQAVHRDATHQRLGDATAAAERWGSWSQEVFADVYSVLSFGTAAVRAMAEFEQHPNARMGEKRERYPPAAIRLQLLARLAEVLGLPDARASLTGLDPEALVEGHAEAEEDLRLIDAVSAASREALPGLGVSLEDLLGFDAHPFHLRWPEVPEPFDLSGPRRMASAALEAWSRTEVMPQGGSAGALDALAEEVKRLVGENRLPGRRSGPPSGAVSVDGQDLADLLLRLDPAWLEAAARGAL